jgi:chitinase
MFNGLPASKVAVGLLACSDAADGFIVPDTVKAAINYLMGTGSKPGAYVLANANGYPELRGMMTWSINWDALPNCGGTYEFANNYESIFGTKKPSH